MDRKKISMAEIDYNEKIDGNHSKLFKKWIVLLL